MPYGDIDITAEYYGYYNQTKIGTFTVTNETVVDFTMVTLPTVNVTGVVIANDSLKPIAGVDVLMTGYDKEFHDVTDADGKFTLLGVYGDHDYFISFKHPKFIEDTMTISVPFENYNIGTITLDDIEAPAFNIIANVNDDNSVTVNWNNPYKGVEAKFDPTLGSDFGNYW
jgi:hypothetical protein